MRAKRKGALTVALVFVGSFTSPAYSHTTLFTPNGGEQLLSGETFSIDWEVTIAHELENWDLWYSTVSSDGPWFDIAMNLVAGDPAEGSRHSFDWQVPQVNAETAWVRVRMDNVDMDYYDVSDAPFQIGGDGVLCDFSGDGACDVSDLNAMLAEGPVVFGVSTTAGVNDLFDLNGDQLIDNSDVDVWLADAATQNGLSSPYRRGDADLSGFTDGQDFIAWNENKFSANLRWDLGDFNGDGFSDGTDFVAWNENKFTSSDSATAFVPEPSGLLLLGAIALIAPRARWR